MWLRARTRNTSSWALLPGTAAVFFGADYLGPANLEMVQPGQEFTLALGADPGVTVTRTQTDDLKKGPGFLSSKSSKIDGWRITLLPIETLIAFGMRPDGGRTALGRGQGFGHGR